MFRKLSYFALLSLTLFSAHAAQFNPGEDYLELDTAATKEKEITEYFSFYCPACFRQEPFMKELEAAIPESATFKKNHVDSMPGRNPQIERLLTKALVTATFLKAEDKMVPAIFNYIHVDNATIDNEKDIRNLFIVNGIEPKSFDKTFSSFAVNTQAKKMEKNTAFVRSQGFTGVPTLIINGKYKPLTNNIKTMKEYQELVLFLLNKKA